MRKKNKQQKQKNNRKKWLKRILLGAAMVLFLTLGAIAGYYGSQLQSFFADIQGEEVEPKLGTSETDQLLSDQDPISILLLGVDEREEDIGRADTLILATLNPQEGSIRLVSIPRDTLVTLPGTDGQLDKINATYAYEGVPYVIETVEELFEVPITFYAQINFDGLVDLVDAVGGIDVYSDLAFTVQDSEENSNAIEIKKGYQHLDGEGALGYARMRKQDPRGDWGRQERQREVIQALMNELLSLNTFTNFRSILGAIGPNLETNLQAGQMWALASQYSHTAEDIETLTLDGAADYIYFPSYGQEVYVWVPDEEVLEETSQELRNHMDLPVKTYDSSIENDSSMGGYEDSSDYEEDSAY